MNVKIVPRTSGAPANKLADAELYFESGPLTGLKLVGFSVLVTMLIVPAVEKSPYSAKYGPFRTSRRSMSCSNACGWSFRRGGLVNPWR